MALLSLAVGPACRHADGTISSSQETWDVWRMASEDSDQLRSGFLMVHRLQQLEDSNQALRMEVLSSFQKLHAARKRQEVRLLCCPEWIPLEERNDHVRQLDESADVVSVQVLLVVVMPSIPMDTSNPEEVPQRMQHISTSGALCYSKTRVDLPAKLISDSACSAGLFDQAQ